MGQVVVVAMQFEGPLWEQEIPGPGGWITPDQRIVFGLPHPPNKAGRAVTGWFAGSAAQQLSELGEEAGLQQALDWLAEASGTQGLAGKLKWYRFKDWVSDPYSEGSYSFTLPGGQEARNMLAKPVGNTVFFAGEATAAAPHYQTVHGAYMSGKRVAAEVAASLKPVIKPPDVETTPELLEEEEPILNPL